MRILFSGLVAATILVISSAISWKAGAATVPGVGSLSPVTKSYVPIEKVGYWRRQYRRAYRRGYYGYSYPYYGYGYYQPYGYYRPYVLWLRLLPTLILIMVMAMAGATRLAARSP